MGISICVYSYYCVCMCLFGFFSVGRNRRLIITFNDALFLFSYRYICTLQQKNDTQFSASSCRHITIPYAFVWQTIMDVFFSARRTYIECTWHRYRCPSTQTRTHSVTNKRHWPNRQCSICMYYMYYVKMAPINNTCFCMHKNKRSSIGSSLLLRICLSITHKTIYVMTGKFPEFLHNMVYV